MLKPVYLTQAMLELGFSQAEIDTALEKARQIQLNSAFVLSPKKWKTGTENPATIRTRRFREKQHAEKQEKTIVAFQQLYNSGTQQ